MVSKSGFNLYRRHKPKLDTLPCQFFISDARKTGLETGDLQALKSRGILTYKKLGGKAEGIWTKKDCS